jgi:Uma2 family endonuclease
MATVILDRQFAELLREERSTAGSDRWDEVWEGTYMMAPLPNNEHQQIAARLAAVIQQVVGWNSPVVILVGANVSDREKGWQHNYRCPDVVVYYPDNPAQDLNTHWCGGPDFAVEIISDDDRTRDKIPFYARVGTRELLIVERDPWRLELLRLQNGELQSTGESTLDSELILASATLPLGFRLVGDDDRPTILVSHASDGMTWKI